jgi:hypothetical protein
MHWKPKSWILIGLLFTVLTVAGTAQVATTRVADTIYHADGTPATGMVIINWPAFTTSSGESIPSGSTSAQIAAGGALSVQLVPNAGSSPMGSYYTVVYHLDDGTVSRQYWVVPATSAAVKVGAIESTVLPTSVAMQTVSKSYVDTAIAAATAGHPLDSTPYVLKAGDTMTGPLLLPADPVSATQAADKNYVDTTVAALTSGLGQMVSTQPSSTQVVAQPAGTELQANHLNGVEYASQYANGRGNNGIANAVGSTDCANGCEVKAEQDYTNEKYYAGTFNNQTHLQDARGGRQVDTYLNPVDVVSHGLSTAQAIDDMSTQSEASLVQQTGNSIPGAIGLSITQEGLGGGSNLFPEQIESPPYFKMGYSAMSAKGTYNTQGQHGLFPEEIDCYGVGDCLLGSHFIYASGGIRDSADEGAHPFDLQTHEDYRVYSGTCTGGCTTGSTTIMTTATYNAGTQGDGRFLIDMNPAKIITSASTGGVLIGGTANQPHAAAQFSGTNFPVSVFLSTGQIIPSQSGNIAPGTVTFSIATNGVPTGYATNTVAIGASSGLACVVDQTAGYAPMNYEMAPYTVVDATHLQMTLSKPHQTLATLAFGGLCGYGLEQTVDTVNGIRQLFPVVGSYSATGVYYAGGTTPVVGAMNQTSGFINVSASIASAVRAANVVTVTTTNNIPADVNGLTVTIAGVADSSYNGNYVVTTTGPNSFTYAQTGTNSSSSGGTISELTGGFAFYPMAEVLGVFDQAAKYVDGQMTLAPNNVAWAVNDPVEEPHYYQEYVSADTEFVGQYVPRPTVTMRAGLQYQQNNGPGLVGWSIANAAPSANYLGYGGTHGAPDTAYEATGIWRRTMNLDAGEQAVFGIQCNQHGCGNWNSGYNLFELGSSAGTDTVAFAPQTSSLSLGLRGTPYSFTPQAFTAGTINVGTLNAAAINGSFSGNSITSGTIAAARLPLFGASGASHAPGIVPDPGATAGSTRFLREDGSWTAPSGGSSTNVATLDSNGRVIPGNSLYGGVLGNDTSGTNLGPTLFSGGHQVAAFNQDGNGGATEILGDPSGNGSDGAGVTLKGAGGCEWGSWHMNNGDGGIFKDAGGSCNNPMASLMLGINGQPVVDMEPDYHLKMHAAAGTNSYTYPLAFTGGAGASNCGTGASFDPGSNDGAGRIVVGSTPPSLCRVTWQHAYVNATDAAPNGWAVTAPSCSVQNEGQRATGLITFTANPSPGDTITIEGVTWRFMAAGNLQTAMDTPIGATAADTAFSFYRYFLGPKASATPGNAPGADPATVHFMYSMPSTTSISLTYTFMDGLTGNAVALSTSNPSAISLPAHLSGGALPTTRSVVSQSGTGGMVISAPGGSLNQGDVLAYTCIAYW